MVNTKIRLIIISVAKDGEVLYSQPKQDWELTVAQIMNLIAKFRLKLKKVGKTTRLFRYDLNQIPYDYTMEVRNRFKGLDLTECLMNYGQRIMTLYRMQGSRASPKGKKCKEAKWLSEEALQIAVKRGEAKGKGKKERYTHLNADFQRIARRDKKDFFSDQCKEIDEKNRMEKTRDLFKKIRDTKETFHAKMGSIKDKNGTSTSNRSRRH